MKPFTPTPEYPHRFCRGARAYATVLWAAGLVELCRFGPAMVVLLIAAFVIGSAVTHPLHRLSDRRTSRQSATPAIGEIARVATTIRVNPLWAAFSVCLDAVFCLALTIGVYGVGTVPSDTDLPGPGNGHILAGTAGIIAVSAAAGFSAWLYTYSHSRSASQHCVLPDHADSASQASHR